MQKNKNKTPTTLNLYVLHIPILLLLIAILVAGGVGVGGAVKKSGGVGGLSGFVLGDDDDDDDDNSGSGSSNDDDDDDGDDDDSDEDDNDNDNDESEDQDDEDDDDDEDNSRSGSGSGSSSDDDEDENEVEDEDEDELENEGIDDDEDEDEDERKFKSVTFDEEGNKIVREVEIENGESKIRYKVYDASGNKIYDYKLETKDGKKVELKIKDGETELSRVKYDAGDGELIVRTGDDDTDTAENRLRIRTEGDSFTLTRSGIGVLANFPMIVDGETGEIRVVTPAGEVVLGAMPDSIVDKAQASDDISDVESVELTEADETEDAELKYVVTGTRAGNLFGLFNLNIPSVLAFDAETGDALETEQSFITRILELFSF